MEQERWLTRLLEVCRSQLENAEKAAFPPSDAYVEDLRRVTEEIERQLAEIRSFARRPS